MILAVRIYNTMGIFPVIVIRLDCVFSSTFSLIPAPSWLVPPFYFVTISQGEAAFNATMIL